MRITGFLGIALIGAFTCLPLSRSSLAAGAAAPFTPAPVASKPCTPLVRMFGEPLCKERMKLDNTNLEHYLKSVPEEKRKLIAVQAQLGNIRKVKAEVWQTALVKKFGIKALTPTDDEIDNYRNTFNSSLDNSYAADKRTVSLLGDMLAKNVYSKSNETKMRRLLDAATMSLKLYGERQQHTEAIPDSYKYITEAAERQMARNMIVSWKSDKILYDTYGGKLVTTDLGVTPIDAYAKFMKYIRQTGKLEIVDKDYTDLFKETEEFINTKHESDPESDKIAENYFSSPTWQFTLANSPKRFEDLKEDLEKIPSIGIKDGADVDEKDMIGKQSRPASPLLKNAPEPEKKP